MNHIDEVRLLLAAIKKVRQESEKAHKVNNILDCFDRINNLNVCLEEVCWKIFGQRAEDDTNRQFKIDLIDK